MDYTLKLIIHIKSLTKLPVAITLTRDQVLG